MKRPIRISEPASDEFTAAVRWYEERRPGLGGEFFDTVVATLSLIETSPEIGAAVSPDLQTRRASAAGDHEHIARRLQALLDRRPR